MKKSIVAIVLSLCLILPCAFLMTGCDNHTHEYGSWYMTKDYSCTEDGECIRKCKYCDHTETGTILAQHKKEEVYDENSHWKVCDGCNGVFDESQHSLGEWAFEDETQTEGIQVRKCSQCGYKEYDLVIDTVSENLIYEEDSEMFLGDEFAYCVMAKNGFQDEYVTFENTYNGKPVMAVGHRAFGECTSLKGVVIPNGITSIEDVAFADCACLEVVKIGKDVESIQSGAFSGCSSLKCFIVDEENQYYKSINGSLYSKDGKTLFKYTSGSDKKRFTIPETVEKISRSCFQYSKLEKVFIPDGVKDLSDYCFTDCSNLSKVVLGKNIETVSRYAFTRCTSLKDIVLPDSVKVLNSGAFMGCTNLKTVYVGKNLEIIHSSCFQGIADLTIKYAGTEEEWNNVTKQEIWDSDSSIKVEYNCLRP